MNNSRRKKIDGCISSLNAAQYTIDKIKENLEKTLKLKEELDLFSYMIHNNQKKINEINSEEEDAYSSLPDNLLNSITGYDMDTAMQYLSTASNKHDTLLELIDKLDELYTTKFIGTYNPKELLEKIDEISNKIDDCTSDLDRAKGF
jgi:uncharacterized coiled-coil DUF342 family protein